MRHVRRVLLALVVAAAIAAGIGILYARSTAARRQILALILREIHDAYDVVAEIDDVEIEVYPPSIVIHGLRVRHPTEGTLLEARRLTLSPQVWPLLRGKYLLDEVALEEPRLVLLIRDGAPANLPRRKAPADEAPAPIVDAFAIVDGSLVVEVEGDGLPAARVELAGVNLDVTGDRNEVFEVRAMVTGGKVRWGAFERPVRRLEARVGVTPSETKIRRFAAALGDDVSLETLRGSVEIGERAAARIGLSASAPLSILSELPEALGLPRIAGDLRAVGEVAYEEPGDGGGEWSSRWTFSLRGARLPDLAAGDISGAVEIGSAGAKASGVSIDTGIGRLHVDGALDWSRAGMPFEGTVRMERLRFGELLERLGVPRSKVVQTFDGTATVSGAVEPFALRADIETDVGEFAVFDDSFRCDDKRTVLDLARARVTGGMTVDREALAIVPTKVRFGSSDLTVTGGYRFADRRFTLDIVGDPLAAGDVGHLVGPAIAGTGPVRVLIDGPIDAPTITAEMTLRDFRYIGKAFGDVRASLHYEALLLRFPEIEAAAGESRYDVADLAFDFRDGRPGRWTASAKIRARPVRLRDVPAVLQGSHDLFADYDGWFEGGAELAYRSWTGEFDVRFDLRGSRVSLLGEPVDSVAAAGRYKGRRIEVSRLRLERLDGWIEGVASVSTAGHVTAELAGGAVPVHRILDGAVGRLGIEALADFTANLQGPLDALTGEGRVTLAGAALRGRPLGEVAFDVAVQPHDRVRARGTVQAGGLSFDALADLSPRPRIGIDVEFADLEPLPFIGDARTDPYRLRISGKTALVVHLGGQRVEFEGKANLSRLEMRAPQGVVRSVGPVWLGFDREGVDVRRAELEFPGGSRATVLGRAGTDRLDLDARGEADLAPLLALFPGAPAARGRLEFGARVTGTIDEPAVIGGGKLRGGRLPLGERLGDLSDVAAEFTVTPSLVTVDALSGRVLGGNLRAGGAVRLGSGLRPEAFDFGIDFGGVSYHLTPTLPVGFDGAVRVSGDRTGGFLPLVTGDVYVMRMVYTDPVRIGVSLGTLGRTRIEPVATFRPQDDFVRFDVRLHSDSGIEVRNNVLEAVVRIDESGQPFRLIGSNQMYGAVGTAVIEHGRLRWRRAAFDVTRGVVTFDSPWKIDPRFDVVAETELRDWRIALAASGRRDDLSILTTSQPELSDEDIVLLLAIGMTRAEAEMVGTGGAVGGALLAEVFGEAAGVSERFDRFVPIVDQMRLSTEYSTRTGRTDPRITLGRRITDDVRVEASSSLTDSREFRAVLSYEMTDRLSLEGVYDNDNEAQFGNVGADVRWRIEF